MKNWKKEYEEIKVPENMKERMEASIARAKMEKRKVKKVKLWKTCASAAAVLAIVLVLPNTSQTAAAAMQQIPLLGNLFKITTVREYQVDEERNMANVKVPQVEVQDTTDGEYRSRYGRTGKRNPQMPSILILKKKPTSLLTSSKRV